MSCHALILQIWRLFLLQHAMCNYIKSCKTCNYGGSMHCLNEIAAGKLAVHDCGRNSGPY